MKTLQPEQSFMVQAGTKHCFFNGQAMPVKDMIELRPGSEGSEKGNKIVYGLALDRLCNAKGLPKRLDHLARLLTSGKEESPGSSP